jgi:predicted NBD/HSP70 family sugar kinase
MKTTGDQQLVKRINRSVLLRLVRAQPGLSRAQVALQSGLTKSPVSTAVRELLDEGWLSEATAIPLDTSVSSKAAGQGRPSTPLHICSRARGLIGIEVAVDCLRVAAVSLLGKVLWSLEEPLTELAPASVCAQVATLAASAHVELLRQGFLLSGVGLGLPGAFEETSGVLRFAPNLGWRNLAFAPMLREALASAGLPEVPLHIQNEADAAALSEYEFAHNEPSDALIFVTCDVGVGAGIVLDDRLYTGADGLAGEIGHTILQFDGPLCSCGRRGCAETFIGARALARELKASGGLAQAGQALGVLLQNLWTSFNPAVLVVGGKSCVQHPALVDIATQTLNTYAASAGMPPPVVRPARYGLFAAAVGAAALVLHRYLRPMPTRGAPSSVDQRTELRTHPDTAAPATTTAPSARSEPRKVKRKRGRPLTSLAELA